LPIKMIRGNECRHVGQSFISVYIRIMKSREARVLVHVGILFR